MQRLQRGRASTLPPRTRILVEVFGSQLEVNSVEVFFIDWLVWSGGDYIFADFS